MLDGFADSQLNRRHFNKSVFFAVDTSSTRVTVKTDTLELLRQVGLLYSSQNTKSKVCLYQILFPANDT